VLGFFPRVDAKQSVVSGVHLAMLGYLAAKWPAGPKVIPGAGWLFGAIFVLATTASFWLLYRSSFPNLNRGDGSLVFFREVAKRKELDFVGRYQDLSDAGLTKDILYQVWRNSVILHDKFVCLRWSYLIMMGSTLPWVAALLACR